MFMKFLQVVVHINTVLFLWPSNIPLWGFPHSSVDEESAAMQETWVPFLGREDSPGEGNGKGISSILAWRISRREEPGRPQSMGSQESDTT